MLTKKLRICAWNINGYYSRTIGIKFLDPDFRRVIRDVDLVCLTETHIHSETLEQLSIPGFQLLGYKNCKKNPKSNTAPGGIAIFSKQNVSKLFTILKTDNEDIVWTKLKKEVTGASDDILIGTCYLSPAREKVNINTKVFKLRESTMSLQSKGHVIINGDLNAWVGIESDTIPSDKYDDNFHISNKNVPPKRNSKHKTTNKRGIELLDMCKSLELNILNGRTVGDPFGEFTSFQAKGNSVVDYLITSESITSEIATFSVGDFVPWLSDHCPIVYDLEINKELDKADSKHPLKPAPKQYIWSDEGTDKFKEELQKSANKDKIQAAFSLNEKDPSKVVDSLTNLLITVANKAKIKTIPNSSRTSNDPPWFDKECVKLKNEIKGLGKERKRLPKCVATRTKLSETKKLLRKIVKRNKAKFKNSLLQEMNWKRKDAKRFWKLLEKLDQKQSDDILKRSISPKDWMDHFKEVLYNPNTPNLLPKNTKKKGPLDFSISDEEIKLGAYILRQGKSSGHDSISNEMISCLLEVNPEIIKQLFNAILLNPTIINKWRTSMITPLHKKGSKTNPDNYRGISLISCFAKYFLAILNQRLLKFVIENKILSQSQLGFLPGNRTSDALLILHNLIDYYCHKKKKYIFGCFVDFSKAFDSIPRSKLFEKLLKCNISGKFYDCLVNLYTKDQACVKISNNVSETFEINQGVKQGCILSPLLFNIFMSDLQEKLEDEGNEPTEIAPNKVCGCLVWADDLLILSESEQGLQNMLNTLHSFSEINGLKANMDKTKVMIFNKSGRHIRRNFLLGGLQVDTTREYKYLGFKLTPSGEINSGLIDLKDRALKAFMKLQKKLGSMFRKYPLITIKLFDTLIKPILLYASDFWGILKMPKNNPFETLYLSFCKQLLGVQKQTTNIGVLLELGLVPLILYAKKNAIKNWNRIAKLKQANTITILSYSNALAQELSWPTQIKLNLSHIGMMETFVLNYQDPKCCIKFFQRLKDIFHQESFGEIHAPNSKLRTYKFIKTETGFESYINLIPCGNERVALSKLRLSNHQLMIEKGRHMNIKKELRFCPICPKKIEDELHFLTICKGFKDKRKTTFDNINEFNRGFKYMDNLEKFKFLLTNKDTIRLTAQFIEQSNQKRKSLIDSLVFIRIMLFMYYLFILLYILVNLQPCTYLGTRFTQE